jgi:hypothetical protein
MSLAAILAPLFLQVLLVMALSVVMARRRFAAAKSDEVKPGAIIGEDSAWPKQARLAANSFNNQFEFPVLFYVLTVLAIITKKADLAFVLMAWIFVLSRYAHAFIHVTSNRMPHRFYAFGAGLAVLLIMWVRFSFQILVAG